MGTLRSSWLMGQFAFASSAQAWVFAASIPGTLPFTSGCLEEPRSGGVPLRRMAPPYLARAVDMYPPSSPMHPSVPRPPRLFKVLCVLTIAGNALLIIVNLFKAGMLWVGGANGSLGAKAIVPLNTLLWAVILTCAGAALGAALMLGGRRLGLRIYTASNIVHLLATFGVMLLWFATVYLMVFGVLLFFYCFIPVGFLLYFRRNGGWLG
jgi:hypothetical protein